MLEFLIYVQTQNKIYRNYT